MLAAAIVMAVAAPAAPAVARKAQSARTLGVTIHTRQRTDVQGRVTETLPGLHRWHVALGTPVQVVATFVSWGNGVDPTAFAGAVVARGATPLITWESWTSAPTGKVQPRLSNAAVAAGRWDAYIRRVADGMKKLHHPIYIRFDHEMNGFWYPWHHAPAAYVSAWRHVVGVFRRRGARNVKWIWAPNAIPWTTRGWLDAVRPYWPGADYVDYVGLTLEERYASMAIYGRHLDLIHSTWPTKPVVLPETNAMTSAYMAALVAFVSGRRWIRNVTWYEQPSFGRLFDRKRMAAEFGQLAQRSGGATGR